MLARIRAAVGDARPPEVGHPALRGAGDVDRFAARVADYRATVTRTDDPDAAVAARLGHHGATRVLDLRTDPPRLTTAELDELDGVVSGCACAIAETGTIVLAGMRAATLVPDLHVCVVRAGQILADVPDAIAALGPGRPLTFVSGPSATSDIELERVEGVHGPRRLEVILTR